MVTGIDGNWRISRPYYHGRLWLLVYREFGVANKEELIQFLKTISDEAEIAENKTERVYAQNH